MRDGAATFDRDAWRALAVRIGDEALAVLRVGDRLRSHPLEDRCDAVDGMGFLIAALLELDAGEVLQSSLRW